MSVIVPARNEEVCLEQCLSSIVGQYGISFEVILVDDGSTDRTSQIQNTFARIGDCPVITQNPDLVRVVAISARTPLPDGWTGKVNALWTGAAEARGKWLLFTDADTVHKPGSLVGAVMEAQEHGAALLSYSPEQEVRGFWQRAVMPVVFSELARRYRPHEICDPSSPVAVANGQYLLVRREAYEAIGGMKIVAGNLLEDVGLARAVKAAGGKLRFRYGGDAVKTRMYRSFEAMQEGWTKNLALLFPNAKQLACLRALEFVAILMLIISAVWAGMNGMHGSAFAAAAAGFAGCLNLILRVHRAHFDMASTFLALAGGPIFAYLLWRSLLFHKSGRITWKGRTYAGSRAREENESVRAESKLHPRTDTVSKAAANSN